MSNAVPRSKETDLVLVGIGVCSGVILFILLAFDGLRVSAADKALVSLAILINLLGFAFAGLARSRALAIGNGGLTLMLIVAVLEGKLQCFCIGGGCSQRFENCAGAAPYVALANLALVAVQRTRALGVVLVSAALTLPVTAGSLRALQLQALKGALASVEFGASCVVRVDRTQEFPPRLIEASRVSQPDEVTIGWWQGERAPRYIVRDGDGARIWRYVRKEFEPLSDHLDADLNAICG